MGIAAVIAPTNDLNGQHRPRGGGRAAVGFVKALRFVADTVFAKRYGHRAVAPETVAVVRADEAHHRDVNHGFADELAGGPVVAAIPAAWPHAELVPHWRDAA